MAASNALQVVVSPFLGILFDNLTSLIRKEVGLLRGVDKEMKKLASTLSTIQAVLQDAEEKQLTNKAIVNWLGKLKDAAYDADDILDEAMQLELGSEHLTSTKRVCHSFLSCFSFEQIKFRRKIAKKINELSQTFNELAAERSNFHLTVGGLERKVELYPSRETSSNVTESQIYGRDEDKEYIVGLLLNNVNNQNDLSVCPILGIGGLGKTTFAQLVYNAGRVKEHFEVRIWVCVSEDFDVKRLTRAVVASISGGGCILEDLDSLQHFLQGKLVGKRFLLVLDDVWNENQEEWDKFKYSLRCGAKGSSLIVTTRLKTVASIMGTCRPYCLKVLSEEDCWSLFRQRAFGMGNEESSNLVKIGKEIVKKCGGIPLAAKVLGGLMRFKEEEKEWLFVRDNGIWDLPKSGENIILPVLRLSYSHLSPHLRQCFAYCSIFPKDHEMKKEELVSLWMANGLFQSGDGIELEDTGSFIFNALSWRSFIEKVVKFVSDGYRIHSSISYMIHDLLHDLACSITINECFNVDESTQIAKFPLGGRHLSLSSNGALSSSIFQSIHQSAPKLRTLLVLNGCGREFPTQFILSAFKCLRALSLEAFEDATLPDSISNLWHLRYLNLSNSRITSLPESICRLKNLQTLKLEWCCQLQKLPIYMRNMSSLRHLNIRGCYELTEMPIGMGQLTCLRTLSRFIVGSDNGRHIKELQEMDHLSGELIVTGLEHVKTSRDAKDANLMRKGSLSSLDLGWSDSNLQEDNDRDVIEGLQPHPNMNSFSISGYQGLTFPSWLAAPSLPNLVQISLTRCPRCEYLPSLGRLPLLRMFSIIGMHSVKFFFNSDDDMVNGFPSLEELKLYEMPELKEWSALAIGNNNGGCGEQVPLFPALRNLNIKECPKLKRLPLLLRLHSLEVGQCNEMILGSLQNIPRLSSLFISDWGEVICFRDGMLQNLTALRSLWILYFNKLKILPTELGNLNGLARFKIHGCKELVSLPEELRNLSSLKHFDISECHELKSLPEVGRSSLTNLSIKNCCSLTNLSQLLRGCQTTLQTLEICSCPKLDFSTVEFQHLIALRHLTFGQFPDLISLPDGIQYVSSTLQTLTIEVCSALVSLPDWIGSLTKLESIHIWLCKNLTILPHELLHLTNLRSLTIEYCHPELRRRCEKERGEDWHKIAHISHLHIWKEEEEEEEKQGGRLQACFGWRQRV